MEKTLGNTDLGQFNHVKWGESFSKINKVACYIGGRGLKSSIAIREEIFLFGKIFRLATGTV
jgi:hypothetical protein